MKRSVRYALLLVLQVVFVFLVDITTFRYRPGHAISGNGNPGVIALVTAWIFFVPFLAWTMVCARRFFARSPKTLKQIRWPLLMLILLLIMAACEIAKIQAYRAACNGFTNNPQSVVFHFGWIHQYSNVLYYNGYILVADISLSLLIGWGCAKISHQKLSSQRLSSHS
ncbi:hypothetical protein P9847_15910 [Paenibacillus chibensis]|uniref:DUF3995 domain-containing protein n=1 Tax=Paenibacillus chibensis TaxID=59846 RepID=A0ABU6PV74_9BACL|nr:hypothetical protein [Paenibacillus chibensis]